MLVASLRTQVINSCQPSASQHTTTPTLSFPLRFCSLFSAGLLLYVTIVVFPNKGTHTHKQTLIRGISLSLCCFFVVV